MIGHTTLPAAAIAAALLAGLSTPKPAVHRVQAAAARI